MSDEALRALERTWRRSGHPDDEARYLAEALRAGRLARPRVEVAAYLRHGPARAALGDAAPAGDHVPWSSWVAAVDAEGRRALLRALVAAARAGLTAAAEPDPAAAHACDLLERWPATPGDEDRRALRAARDGVAALELQTAQRGLFERALVAICLSDGCLLALAPDPESVGAALRRVTHAARKGTLPWPAALPAVVAPVLAWALGPGHAYAPAGPETPDGVGAYLRARLREGEVPRSRLGLAAYAGEAGAAAALDLPPVPPVDVVTWVEGLAELRPALAARAAAGVAGHLLRTPLMTTWLLAPATPRGHAVRGDVVQRAQHACDALREWAERPTAAARERVAACADDLAPGELDRAAPGDRAVHPLEALRAALACALGARAPAAALRAALDVVDDPAEVDVLARGLVAGWALAEP
ncbi:MAG: hypothetical protein M9894_08195 [Planctomycetes bacterium]|nr:hypothetical protein [Planctomycetota bacterium]